MVDSDYVMIMNVGRTGSTWLSSLLGRHPEVLDACETNFFATTDEAVGPSRYGVRQILLAWLNRHAGVTPVPLSLLSKDELIEVVHNHLIDICSRALSTSGARVMVDKSPAHMLSVSSQEVIHSLLPDATMIHFVRDFRAVWLSFKATFPDYWLVRSGVNGFCETVSAAYDAMDAFSGGLEIPTFRYEEIKADPSRISGILSAIGVDASPGIVSSMMSEDDGRQGRFDGWTSGDDPDMQVVSEKLRHLLTRYGYER